VGSCTDLIATVSYPLRRIYGDQFVIGPLSVLVDPIRAQRIFGLRPGGTFSPEVSYFYRKQLQEADLIVINKLELATTDECAALRAALAQHFPGKPVREVSARLGTNLTAWFDEVTRAPELLSQNGLDIDYGRYADGEAQLGWLNATIRFTANPAIDANALLTALGAGLQQRLKSAGAEIAHLKMTLEPDPALNGIASLNLVRNDSVPELALTLDEPVNAGDLIVNIRAETAPETLSAGLQTEIQQLPRGFPGLAWAITNVESFRPGKPQPTHRFTPEGGDAMSS
jgi:hypothetical protein